MILFKSGFNLQNRASLPTQPPNTLTHVSNTSTQDRGHAQGLVEFNGFSAGQWRRRLQQRCGEQRGR